MKAFLICPSDRQAVAELAVGHSLVLRPVLGQPLLVWWLEAFCRLGAQELILAAADRPHQLRAFVGAGERWGLRIQVLPQPHERSPHEARAMYHPNGETGWLAAPNDFVLLDHLPGKPQPCLFGSYMAWFAGVMAALQRFDPTGRIGVREVEPGVWIGPQVRLARTARLVPPCWIGAQSLVGPHTEIGPAAVLEDRVVVERGSRITQSIVGPQTFVGAWTELRQVLVEGDQLVGWRRETCLRVADESLLAALPALKPGLRRWRWPGRDWWRRWRTQPAPMQDLAAPALGATVRSLPGESSTKRAA